MAELRQTVTIRNQRGLHARAAAKFVKTVEIYPDVDIKVEREEACVSGLSIMGLLMLSAGPQSTITITAAGVGAEEALAALVGLVEGRFGEEV
jgi:phosphocarrier protein HPr